MKTNYLMLMELLGKYHPEQRGIISADEEKLVRSTLHIDEMNILALRNLRDFVVAIMGDSVKMEDWDRMSAIVCVIDSQLLSFEAEI